MTSLSLTKISKKESSKFSKLKKKEEVEICAPLGKFTKIDSPESKTKFQLVDRSCDFPRSNGISQNSPRVERSVSSSKYELSRGSNNCQKWSNWDGSVLSSENGRSRKISDSSTKSETCASDLNGKHNFYLEENNRFNQDSAEGEVPKFLSKNHNAENGQHLTANKIESDSKRSDGSSKNLDEFIKNIDTSTRNSDRLHDIAVPGPSKVSDGNRRGSDDTKPVKTNNASRPPLNRRRSTYVVDLITGISETMSQESPEPPEQSPVDVPDDVLDALNSMTLIPEPDTASESSSHSSMTSHRDEVTSHRNDVKRDTNGVPGLWMEDKTPEKVVQDEPEERDVVKKKKLFKNPIKMLKKTMSQGEMTPPLFVPEEDINSVTIDTLPQQFVTKFLGKKKCNGLQGLEYIRGPIDKMVREVTGNPEADELPLVQLTVWPKGLQATIHPKTRSRDFQPFYLPIDFISFCAEHGNYQKIVGVISVTHLGPKTTKTECSAYICHSALEARKLTVSMATAFKMYAERLNGSQVKFKVDLRPEAERGRGPRRKPSTKEFDA